MSTIQLTKQPDGTVCATLTTKRNDQQVNSHNLVTLEHRRANVDLKIIVDILDYIHYMAKYAAKSEPKSKPVQAVFKSTTFKMKVILGKLSGVQLSEQSENGISAHRRLHTCFLC